jgi:D-alanyl-lipoteichoic acid acyltransferase DltB (MBOAT superfamily)
MIGTIIGIPFLTEKTELNQYFSSLLSISNFEIILPATISYYTFQFISLGVDCKNSKMEPPSLFDLSSFILFFPIMIAGPVTRLVDFKQNFSNPSITEDSMRKGLWLISMGLIKKVILSDSISSIIFPVFAEPDKYSGFSLLLNSYFFAMNLYLDFSGLTDLARGMGVLFGYELPENFKAPFFMNGFADFWRRWHLSFSFWIRDYIYIPLGGSRVSEWRNYLNLIITFALGGLWHGANLNYFLWGILTGFFISIERFFEVRNILFNNTRLKKVLYYILVLHMYIITWNLFFTKNLSDAWFVISRIILFSKGFTMPYIETGIYVTLLGVLFHLSEQYPDKFYIKEKYKKYLLPILGTLFVLVILNSSNRDFFYGKY